MIFKSNSKKDFDVFGRRKSNIEIKPKNVIEKEESEYLKYW